MPKYAISIGHISPDRIGGDPKFVGHYEAPAVAKALDRAAADVLQASLAAAHANDAKVKAGQPSGTLQATLVGADE